MPVSAHTHSATHSVFLCSVGEWARKTLKSTQDKEKERNRLLPLNPEMWKTKRCIWKIQM